MFAPLPTYLWLSIATSIGAGVLALLVWRQGLACAYKWFVSYLVAESLLGFLYAGIGSQCSRTTQAAYFLIYQPVLWIFYLMMIREIHAKSLARFPGIARAGQQVLVYGLVGSIILSVVTVQPDLQTGNHDGATWVLYITAAHRVVTGGFTLFLLLLTVILSWFPIPTSRNTVLHTTLSFFFFLLMTVTHLFRNLSGKANTAEANLGITTLVLLCLAGWAKLLRPAGEVAMPPARTEVDDASWILSQMESLNRALLRGVK
ncbi:MAG: hypothetical protein INH43_22595 [Acidobacteriaceae bacterium]|nr:hypothetical protein [Acidobacteriaceae bacterium]